MDGIPDSTFGWVWWLFSVVIVSFIVNILSSYSKPVLDNLGMKYSENRRKRIFEAKEKFEKVVDSFNTPEGINYLKIELLSIYIQMALTLLLTIITGNVMYDFIDLSMKFLNFGSLFVFVARETIAPIVTIIGLIVLLFLLNKSRLVNSILKAIYSKDARMNYLADISL